MLPARSSVTQRRDQIRRIRCYRHGLCFPNLPRYRVLAYPVVVPR